MQEPSKVIIRFFNDLLIPLIQRMKKDFCAENYLKIFKFFRSTFGLVSSYNKSREAEIENRDEIMEAIGKAYE